MNRQRIYHIGKRLLRFTAIVILVSLTFSVGMMQGPPFDTTTALSSTPNPSLFGDPVTFTATVTAVGAGAPTPTGDVSFVDTTSGTLLGTATLDGTGQASITTSALTAGTHNIQATYTADPGFNTSSDSLTQTVNARTTTTTLTSSLNPSNVGDPVTFTATVTALGAGAPTVTGSVSFVDTTSGTTLGTTTLAGGSATLVTNVLTAGLHTIQATYNGTPEFNTSSDSLIQTVIGTPPFDTTTVLTSSLNPSNVGDSVTFTATVTAGSGIPTGSVTFLDTTTGTNLGTVALDGSGQAALTTNALAAGSHAITATYSPNSINFLGSTSSPLTQIVIGAGTFDTTTALTTSLNPSNVGDPVTFTTQVTAEAGAPPVTGTVAFTDGATPLGTVLLDAAGQAALTTNALAAGTHTIQANYNGTAELNPSSDSITQTVNGSTTTTTDTLPALPDTPRCEDLNFVADGVVRASTPDGLDYAVFCRVLYANGVPVQWLGGDLYNAGSIGNQGVLDLGVVQAVDVYSPTGMTEFEGGVEICLKGTGPLIFMAASGAPRQAVLISSHAIDDFAGYECATLFEPGTLVLVRENPVE